MKAADLENKPFEELAELLDESVQALESDGLTLDEMLEAYERAVFVVAACVRLLDGAELRVKKIDELLDEQRESNGSW